MSSRHSARRRDWTMATGVVASIVCACFVRAAQPDLILWGPAMSPRIESRAFTSNDCEVVEGCAQVGQRRLLRFTTETRNIGASDLVLGNPANNPLFEFATCHGHFHFADFADYRLLDSSGLSVGVGLKVGFCLEDVSRFDPAGPSEPRYDCGFQGIQAGWADIYVASLPCQWIDISSTPPGIYTLEIEVDPSNRLPESNESNNVASGFVVINPPCTSPPANDNFVSAQAITSPSVTVIGANSCSSREGGEPRHADNMAERSVWYRWVAPYTGAARINTLGSSFDTLLAVYRGNTVGALTGIASNDDAQGGRWSAVTFAVTNSGVYYVAIDGWNGAEGGVALNINPATNDRFTNCLPIAGLSGTVAGVNSGAGGEAFEPPHAGQPAGRSLWYCWIAPTNGPFRFHTRGSSFDTRLAIYTGTTLSNLVEVAGNDDVDTSRASVVLFDAIPGTVYLVAVTGSREGVVSLSWAPAVRPVITSIVPASTNAFELALSGQPGDTYLLQRSGDLRTWVDLLPVTNVTGTVQYQLTNAAPQRFLRALVRP